MPLTFVGMEIPLHTSASCLGCHRTQIPRTDITKSMLSATLCPSKRFQRAELQRSGSLQQSRCKNRVYAPGVAGNLAHASPVIFIKESWLLGDRIRGRGHSERPRKQTKVELICYSGASAPVPAVQDCGVEQWTSMRLLDTNTKHVQQYLCTRQMFG